MTREELVKELEVTVGGLEKQFGYTKVNLQHEDRSCEGIWAVPVDETSSKHLRANESPDTFARVRLCNRPLGWGGLTWGGLVKVRLNGDRRALALLEDQTDQDLIDEKHRLMLLLVPPAVPGESDETEDEE